MNTETSLNTELTPSNQPTYMIQLDALRALAVFGVLLNHFFPALPLTNFLEPGVLGVHLFFVLSGFLITGILLKCKDKVTLEKSTSRLTIRRFYIRRFLRIFPIYYLTLFLALLFNVESVRESFFWYFTYLSNIEIQMRGSWTGNALHFWTLAVEEQFYLVWPWLIIFIPKKHLHFLIITTILTGIMFKVVYPVFNPSVYDFGIVLSLGHIDSLGFGSLLALYTYEPDLCKWKKRLLNCGFWVGLPLFIALPIIRITYPENPIEFVLKNAIFSLFFVWIVARTSKGFGGFIGSILELKPLLYLGKISYGIYVYHLFMPLLISSVLSSFGLQYPTIRTVKFLLNTSVTLVVAILSWHLIENPINNLKRHFPYTSKNKVEVAK